LKLAGNKGAMKSKALTFSVNRCQNTTKNDHICATPKAIDNYIKDLSIDYWAVEWNMDLT